MTNRQTIERQRSLRHLLAVLTSSFDRAQLLTLHYAPG